MSKLVVFYGSPRPDGFTARLLDQVAAGAAAAGAAGSLSIILTGASSRVPHSPQNFTPGAFS